MKITKNKHILFDTCLISYIFNKFDYFKHFLDELIDLSCTFCINEFLYLEFIRISKNKKEKESIASFLDEYFFNLPITPDIYQKAKELYPLYNHCKLVRNKNQISITDLINVAFLKKYSDNLLFITLDHSDYPLEILHRKTIGSLDLETEIITWGIYCFKEEGFSKLKKSFNRI